MRAGSAPWIVVALLCAVRPGAGADDGSVRVEPNEGVAGNFGTWTVTYRAGSRGIHSGGGLRVQLPDSWHSGDRNSANRLQASDPKADHYVSARSSRPGVLLETEVESESPAHLVKAARRGLDGRLERYVFVVRVTVREGELPEGDTISVVYGDASGGSRGMKAASISTDPEPILVEVDPEGTGAFRLHPDRPTLMARSGPAAELLLCGPSSLVVGQPAVLHLAVVDAQANPDRAFDGEITLSIRDGDVKLPVHTRFERGRGWQTVTFTPRRAGIVRLAASARDDTLRALSNPMKVYEEEPDLKVYWGDLHSHTRYSWDGVGDRSFEYARDVSGLDFYAMTDHSRTGQEGYTRGLGPEVWGEYTAATERHDEPGRFVTLHAYEASFGAPWGHHNVLFRGTPGPLLAPGEVTLPQLWAELEAGRALTIPHHTGKFPVPVRWDDHDPELRRNIEIYSAHGSSEAYDPTHPLAFEHSDFTAASRSAEGPQFGQDAWARGLVLSTIASSDDHRAHPGQPHWGLAAVLAPRLTREDIFDALYRRGTYGTTGTRILLDFAVQGVPMGGETRSGGSPRLSIEAHASDLIERIDVLRYGESAGGFEVLFSLRPEALDLEWSATDETFHEDSIYYVRLRQRGLVRGRIVMAWSSPIWVRKTP
jgi:hypothetical protein